MAAKLPPAQPLPSRPGAADTSDDVPDVGGRAGTAPPPKGEVQEPWYWVASPERWQVMKGRIVPILRKIVLNRGGGIGNVDSVGEGMNRRADPSLALARAAQRGETVLLHGPMVKLPDGRMVGYLQKVKATGSWISRWETVYGGTTATTIDEEGFSAWLASKVEDGTIPPAPIYVLHQLRDNLENQLNSYRDKSGIKAAYGTRISRMEKDLKVVEKAIHAHGQAGGVAAEVEEAEPEIGSKGASP